MNLIANPSHDGRRTVFETENRYFFPEENFLETNFLQVSSNVGVNQVIQPTESNSFELEVVTVTKRIPEI